MAYNLTIDQGNTAAKLALWDHDKLVALSIEPRLSAPAMLEWLRPYQSQPILSVLCCSVAPLPSEVVAEMKHVVPVVKRLTPKTPLPIKIEYGIPGHPCTLGTDRIAAAVGAWATFPQTELLVVDAGTAVTYDHVTADGRFVGGNIAPGMRMRLDALHRYTARLPKLEVPWDFDYPHFLGTDTESAMILGAIYGIVGAISYYQAHLPKGLKVVMTGGWAKSLSRLCDFEVEVAPDLVSKGLNQILLYNQR
ncbi:MAG: type III pantothenate kinase [Bacteroidales bacterium]|nr:type III pantothenate kinase [Bacteroidales bacterium]